MPCKCTWVVCCFYGTALALIILTGLIINNKPPPHAAHLLWKWNRGWKHPKHNASFMGSAETMLRERNRKKGKASMCLSRWIVQASFKAIHFWVSHRLCCLWLVWDITNPPPVPQVQGHSVEHSAHFCILQFRVKHWIYMFSLETFLIS